jgi:hypothetical protein
MEEQYEDKEYIDKSIIEYANYLYKNNSWENMIKIISEQRFDVTEFKHLKKIILENKIIKIKYMEHCQLWKPKWARQSRGVILRLNDDNIIVCDKMLLIRGAEVLTGIHLKAGVNETQDISFSGSKILDDSQNNTVMKLINRLPIEGIVSFKNDGSLLGITLYEVNSTTAQFYLKTINKFIDDNKDNKDNNESSHFNNSIDFAKTIIEMAEQMNLPFIPIFSSQGTIFLGEDMHDYMVTSILVGTNCLSQNQLDEIATNESPIKIFNQYGRDFLEKLRTFYDNIIEPLKKEAMCLSFEAICNFRKSSWNKHHPELAISYPETMLRFLGCTFNVGLTVGIYKAHYQLEDIIEKVGFEQPLWWRISHSIQIENMMIDLSKTIMNQMNEAEYLDKYKPSNSYLPKHLYFDYEGWIFYKENTDGTIDYSKIKTEEYYKAHKFKPENVKMLIELGKFAKDIFPLTKVVTIFFDGLSIKLLTIMNEILDYLQNKEILFNGLPEKAQISFPKQNEHVKIKMLINASSLWQQLCFDVFKKTFDSLEKTNEVDMILKSIVLELKPWLILDTSRSNLDANIIETINQSPLCLRNLFGKLNSFS